MIGVPVTPFGPGFSLFILSDNLEEHLRLFGNERKVGVHTLAEAVFSVLSLLPEEKRLCSVRYEADGRWRVDLAGDAFTSAHALLAPAEEDPTVLARTVAQRLAERVLLLLTTPEATQ
jgi:hypothetical protein